MNSFSTFGILIVLLFACYAPTQGQTIAVSDVAFENGGRYKSTKLIKTSDGAYKIEKRDGTFGIEGIDTVAGKDVVLRTNDKSYIQMELVNALDSQRLLTLTSRSKLHSSIYWYGIATVFGYPEGFIADNVHFSGYEYSTTGEPQHRCAVHTGMSPSSTESEVLLLWTQKEFNYQICGTGLMFAVKTKPADGKFKYYLLEFHTPSYRFHWIEREGNYYKNDVPSFPGEVCEFFKKFLQS